MQKLLDKISEELNFHIKSQAPIGGGCTHPAYKINTNAGDYFIKTSGSELATVFIEEAEGLNTLAKIGTIGIPIVKSYGRQYLLLEFIPEEEKTSEFWKNLGIQLAEMHLKSPRNSWGFTIDNHIGKTPQLNPREGWPEISWAFYFMKYRIAPLAAYFATDLDFLQMFKAAEPIMHHALAGIIEGPCLCHGDLWNGNILCGPRQKPYLIDPAPYYGHREVDLAMSELFGGFDPEFYSAYNMVYPVSLGYEKRKKIYNLYHMLNHWKLFGESYKGSVRNLLGEILTF